MLDTQSTGQTLFLNGEEFIQTYKGYRANVPNGRLTFVVMFFLVLVRSASGRRA